MADTELPYSQSCENNKVVIGEHLTEAFAGCPQVLEIASGTGQHATYFADILPAVKWQPTEIPANMATLEPRCALYSGENLLFPRPLDVTLRPWKAPVPEAVFTANSLHIMPYIAVVDLFQELGQRAETGTILAVYGPFNYGGQYTSESNARFDLWLARQHPLSAIRNFESVDQLAQEAGFQLQADYSMPANNRLLVWHKVEVAIT